eukprot:5848962-Prymnesium_polylepis.1
MAGPESRVGSRFRGGDSSRVGERAGPWSFVGKDWGADTTGGRGADFGRNGATSLACGLCALRGRCCPWSTWACGDAGEGNSCSGGGCSGVADGVGVAGKPPGVLHVLARAAVLPGTRAREYLAAGCTHVEPAVAGTLGGRS